MKNRLSQYLWSGAAVMLLSACNGLFSDIYDEAPDESTSEYGFVEMSSASSVGKIYVNASDYTRWTYLSFHDLSMDTLAVTDAEPVSWDLAIHRYDAKTHGGAVAETSARDFNALSTAAIGTYQSDVWTTQQIVTDMSHMMDGYLSYVESDYNALLSEWLNVDTSSMPPTYTLSNKIYMIRLADGTRAAVRLSNYMNAAGVKGYMTIEYMYPVK